MNKLLEQSLKNTGFEVCEFGPDDDPCEKCAKNNEQLYFLRTDYFSMDGEYRCAECVIQLDFENQRGSGNAA